jgi:primosomal protein N' (replication factor Y)
MDVEVGSVVRVPLGGRRVRGWVTAIRNADREGLKEIIGVSGAHPVFTVQLLQTLRWAAVHYVSPLAALIPKAAPPNLAKRGFVALDDLPEAGTVPPLAAGTVAHLEAGDRPMASFMAGSGPWLDVITAAAGASAASGRSSLIVVPTAVECAALAAEIRSSFGNRVVSTTSAAPAAQRTAAWSQAKGSPGTIVVGTPEVALWPIASAGIAIVVEAGRRAMKSRQTPTVHVRELLRRRTAVEKFGLLLLGQMPTLETAAAAVSITMPAGRVWPLVEVIDRDAEPPTGNPLAEATRAAIAGAARRDEPVFVFVSRRGYAPAARCTSCGDLRRCPECGSSPGQGATCDRCGVPNGPCAICGGGTFTPIGAGVGRVLEGLQGSFGDLATSVGDNGVIQVGTERDVPASGSVGLAVVVDADSMLLRPHYRAEEDTLRILTRVASTVRRGRGHRCVVQTRMAEHRVLQAMRHGTGSDVIASWLAERDAEQLPPYGELLALELTDAPSQTDATIRELAGPGVAVFGPGELRDGSRWLVQAPDLRPVKIRLRPQVQSWRDRGMRVRVDADPLDV